MSDDTTVWTPLTVGEIKQARAILSNTPISALLSSHGGTQIKDVGHLVAQLGSIVTFLKHEMDENENLKDELLKINGEIGAAGRLLQRMSIGFAKQDESPSAREVLKAVEAAVMIRHKFDTDDVQQIADAHGIDL